MTQPKQIKVNAIKNGTVIDHIGSGKAIKVLEILNLKGDEVVMVGINLHSKKYKCKDLIKIEKKELTSDEVNSIALISPHATVTIIKDYNVARKIKLEIPEYIENLIQCPNPKCITNLEKINSKFRLTADETTSVRCEYCEKKYKIDEVNIHI
ncbi:MAG: aspartate carbamoyltransferase regulatory subunit [Candidatus Cloacimonadota bacterium]|nr:aspartate carbamoyltransferase regulatory subunit [Candidatus Cloacimonadota bacterium]